MDEGNKFLEAYDPLPNFFYKSSLWHVTEVISFPIQSLSFGAVIYSSLFVKENYSSKRIDLEGKDQ